MSSPVRVILLGAGGRVARDRESATLLAIPQPRLVESPIVLAAGLSLWWFGRVT